MKLRVPLFSLEETAERTLSVLCSYPPEGQSIRFTCPGHLCFSEMMLSWQLSLPWFRFSPREGIAWRVLPGGLQFHSPRALQVEVRLPGWAWSAIGKQGGGELPLLRTGTGLLAEKTVRGHSSWALGEPGGLRCTRHPKGLTGCVAAMTPDFRAFLPHTRMWRRSLGEAGLRAALWDPSRVRPWGRTWDRAGWGSGRSRRSRQRWRKGVRPGGSGDPISWEGLGKFRVPTLESLSLAGSQHTRVWQELLCCPTCLPLAP